jgi:hypothetical protein
MKTAAPLLQIREIKICRRTQDKDILNSEYAKIIQNVNNTRKNERGVFLNQLAVSYVLLPAGVLPLPMFRSGLEQTEKRPETAAAKRRKHGDPDGSSILQKYNDTYSQIRL